MDFINSIKNSSLSAIKTIVESKTVSLDDNWLDYKALNKVLEQGRKDVAMYFLDKNFRVNNTTSSNTPATTPLHYGVRLGDADLVDQLLEKQASLTVYDYESNTPLHLAFVLKYDTIVDLILSCMEKTVTYINCKNNQSLTHLHIASTRKNKNVIEGLLKAGASIKDKVAAKSFQWAGYTALHFAVEFKSLEAVKILASASECSECTIKNSSDRTPLQLLHQSLEEFLIMAYHLERKDTNVNHDNLSYFDVACLRSDKKLVKKFIENGAEVNEHLDESAFVYPSSAPLHLAIETKCKENVVQLIQNGANINHINAYKMTPLHLALYTEDPEVNDTIVDKLYAALHNIEDTKNLADDNNLSFFHIAVTRNDLEMVKNYLDKSIDLVHSKVLPNSYGFSNFTPLHFAILYQHMETAKLLIERGAYVNVNDEGPYGTPLQIACSFGNAGLIELLLKSNADVKVVQIDKLTPIHQLAEYYKSQDKSSRAKELDQQLLMYVDQMVKLGCDINAQDKDGNTALHYLSWELDDSASFVRLFLELGTNINLENTDLVLPFNVNYYKKKRINSDEYALFYDHVQNLKALGMEVHPKNEECCKVMLKDRSVKTEGINRFSDEELTRKEKQRCDEIIRMKFTMLTDYLRLYDFMLLDPRRAAVYANNNVLKIVLNGKDFEKQYPLYFYLIRLQQQKGENFLKYCHDVR